MALPRRLSGPVLVTGALLFGVTSSASGGCTGSLGGGEGGGGGAGGGAAGGGGAGAGGGLGGAAATGGLGGSAGAGGDGGSVGGAAGAGGATSGGAGGTPLTCVAAGPKDCSATAPSQYDCADIDDNFRPQVNAAIVAVRDGNPSWFDYNLGPAPCCPLALNTEGFLDGVVAHLNGAGLCAERDPNNPFIEITVKLNNACNEGYSILTSGDIVRQPPHYNYTCAPAWQ